jgi:hypothetical protein
MNGLFGLLYDALPVGPSQTLPSGKSSRGWTLREDRLNGNAMRFDWIHGSSDTAFTGDAAQRVALRDDVLAAAARVANSAGFRVKADGIGLLIVAASRNSLRNR